MDIGSRKIAWLFPGQGSQEVGMGAKLFKKFRRAEEFIRMAEDLCGENLSEIMRRGPEQLLSRTEIVQPAMVALSCGYVDLLRDAGERPDVVAGHSLGELSALYAAEVLTAESAIQLACERGRLMAHGQAGGMVAVKSVDLATLEAIIDSIHDAHVCLANYNAPSQLVVSGEEYGLAQLCEQVSAAGGGYVRLNVSGAWHSPLVAVAAHEFEKYILATPFNDPRCPLIMGSTALVATDARDVQSTLLRQMTRPVRWYEAIESMYAKGCRTFYEVGSGKVLKGLMRRILEDESTYKVQGIEHGPTIDRLLKQSAACQDPQRVQS